MSAWLSICISAPGDSKAQFFLFLWKLDEQQQIKRTWALEKMRNFWALENPEMHSMHWSVMGHSVHPIMHRVSLYLDATQQQSLLISGSFTQPFALSPFAQQTMADGCVL